MLGQKTTYASKNQFILVRRPKDVEIEVDVAPVDTRNAFKHNDLGCWKGRWEKKRTDMIIICQIVNDVYVPV